MFGTLEGDHLPNSPLPTWVTPLEETGQHGVAAKGLVSFPWSPAAPGWPRCATEAPTRLKVAPKGTRTLQQRPQWLVEARGHVEGMEAPVMPACQHPSHLLCRQHPEVALGPSQAQTHLCRLGAVIGGTPSPGQGMDTRPTPCWPDTRSLECHLS